MRAVLKEEVREVSQWVSLIKEEFALR
jgi:hypothetical protein